MAASGVFSTDAKVGISLQEVATVPKFQLLISTNGSNAKKYVYVRAGAGLGSTANVNVGTGGTATSGSAGSLYTVAIAGGVTSGQYFWAEKKLT